MWSLQSLQLWAEREVWCWPVWNFVETATKKMTLVKKWANNKKATFFVQLAWDWCYITYSWVNHFDKVSLQLGQNCGSLIMDPFFSQGHFFVTVSSWTILLQKHTVQLYSIVWSLSSEPFTQPVTAILSEKSMKKFCFAIFSLYKWWQVVAC